MQEFCHRCGAGIPAGSGESPFCPHCGAPQLYLSLENQSVETGGEVAPPASDVAASSARARQVEWKTAIRCAAAVAGVGGLLSLVAIPLPMLKPASLLWIVSASLITMGLYQNRRPLAWMDAGVGARIGVLVGLCLALGLAIPLSAAALLERYIFHAMGSFDAEMAAEIQQRLAQSTTPMPPEAVGLANSPEFRAGSMLFVFGCASVVLLAVSTLGGAFAGLLRMRRRPAA